MGDRLTSDLLADSELEVLAPEDPARRQPIADAVCRYLREATGPTGLGGQTGLSGQTEARQNAVALLAALARQHPDASCDADCAHCLDLDLDTAVLPDVDFGGCRLGDVSFTGTRFCGTSVFAGARFSSAADFGRARFRADADFSRVRFAHPVSFADATFAMEAWFWRTRFGGPVSFQRAVFGGRVHLIQPTVDLTGARLSAAARAKGEEWPEGQDWPAGWTTASELEEDGAALVVRDEAADGDSAAYGPEVVFALNQLRAGL